MEASKKVFDFLEKAGTFYLATVEGDQPRVRPYGAMLYFEDKIYIMAFGKTNATRQIAANQKAEICAFKGQTLRIACTLVEDNRPEVGKALVDKMPVLKNLGRERRDVLLKGRQGRFLQYDGTGRNDYLLSHESL